MVDPASSSTAMQKEWGRRSMTTVHTKQSPRKLFNGRENLKHQRQQSLSARAFCNGLPNGLENQRRVWSIKKGRRVTNQAEHLAPTLSNCLGKWWMANANPCPPLSICLLEAPPTTLSLQRILHRMDNTTMWIDKTLNFNEYLDNAWALPRTAAVGLTFTTWQPV